jgi:hypothetical protein
MAPPTQNSRVGFNAITIPKTLDENKSQLVIIQPDNKLKSCKNKSPPPSNNKITLSNWEGYILNAGRWE